MSQSFFVVSPKIGDFANQFLNTVLQCCPTVLGVFPTLMPTISAAFGIRQGSGRFFEKKQNNFCCFQKVFNFSVVGSLPAAGIFCFFRQFSVSFRIFHFLPIHKIRKRGYQIQQIQFAMQKAASNTRKTITVHRSAGAGRAGHRLCWAYRESYGQSFTFRSTNQRKPQRCDGLFFISA